MRMDFCILQLGVELMSQGKKSQRRGVLHIYILLLHHTSCLSLSLGRQRIFGKDLAAL